MYDNMFAQTLALESSKTPLTDFSSVTSETNLETLNLNWRECDLPEHARTKHVHRLHPYMGKYIPQLVEIFLHKFRPSLVYDPFCGSGTTLVEANSCGIDAIGTDISAFNVLLSKVKTADYDIHNLRKDIDHILDTFLEQREILFPAATESNLFEKQIKNIFGHSGTWTSNSYIDKWFAPQARLDLLCYRNLIKNYSYKDVLKIILSRSARSSRLVTHFDLDFPKRPQTKPYTCYKHGRTCTPVQEAKKFLSRYSIDTFKRIQQFHTLKTQAKTEVIHGDARDVSLPIGIDLVVTSPPYIGMIDYHEQHKYAYEFLELPKNESKEIGAAKQGISLKGKNNYLIGINDVFRQTRQFMTKNGVMVIVVHDKHNLYDPKSVGFTSIGRVERLVNRRTGRRKNNFCESILIWKKQ